MIYLVLLTPAAALPGLLLMDLLEQWALGQRRQARVRASRPSTPGAHVAPFHGSSRTTRATPAVAPPARAGVDATTTSKAAQAPVSVRVHAL